MKTHFYFCLIVLAGLLTSATPKREKIHNFSKMPVQGQTRVSIYTTLTRKLASSGRVVPVNRATIKNLTTGQSTVTNDGGQSALDFSIGDQVRITLPKNAALDLGGQSSVLITWTVGQPLNKTIETYLTDIESTQAWSGTVLLN
ncbi:hypothetical protein HDF26_004304 [Pedobacter cryoconitis]|uniref:Uncharacterized protein n=1 Tax=Pedobacter cryoconitis TaxID=188932 RepID=A0A7W9E0X6_9SPHI|nr:hypothetical protein [Pedobacter cryoconitis]MBB5637075.1 hypothetical protein [Pedobacter cryoconitis]MBB6273831.1 hypothetical protein [Pedobacter cryoconitis]